MQCKNLIILKRKKILSSYQTVIEKKNVNFITKEVATKEMNVLIAMILNQYHFA